jgi:hypothetical protein
MQIEKLAIKKGSLVHVASACTGFGEGSDYFGSYVRRHTNTKIYSLITTQ